jgi:hypothetical protein
MRANFVACCASALAPYIVSTTTIAKSPAHFRFWILDFRLSEQEPETRSEEITFTRFFPQSKMKI